MIEQIIILILLVGALAVGLYLYYWKAKKHMEYKADERWESIQNKANAMANHINYALIVALAVVITVDLFVDIDIAFSLNRVCLIFVIYLGIRNAIELFAIKYYDKQC